MGLFYKYITEQYQLDKMIPVLYERSNWAVDTETTGLDPYNDQVVLLQIGNRDIQYVIDVRTVNIQPLRLFLESQAITKVMHNGKFDYKMIKANHGIETESIVDTFLGEKCLSAGKKKFGFDLASVLKARLNVELDKEAQTSFIGHKGDFSRNQIEYAATDVIHLVDLMEVMKNTMRPLNLLDTWKVENYALPAFADMELDGLKLDTHKWTENIKANQKASDDLVAKMNEYAKIYLPCDMFGEPVINYGSQVQVLKLLQEMDVQVPVWENSKEVDSLIGDTSDKTLKKVREGYPIIDLLKKYRGHQVRISTFGQSYIDAIHPATGRIHPQFHQYGTETGRPAKAASSPINPLNVPRDKVFRNAFIADEDWLVETDDYSGCELRIWAEVSEDPALMEAFRNKIDVHCMVASRLYGKEVTKKNENAWMRTPAKSMNFGIIYGMGPSALCEKIREGGVKITLDETKKLYRKYTQEEFPTGVNYLREVGREAVINGYAVSKTGRRRYWVLPNPNDENTYPGGKGDKKYLGRIASIEREGGNHIIQSVNADMTKYAMYLLRLYKKKHGIRTKIINQVYDEIVTTTHKDDSPDFHKKKQEIMMYAAEMFLKKIPMEVEGEVLPYWTK